MDSNINPCIIYQRLRPSAPEASELARQTIWPWAEKFAAHKGYTVCGLYGDSEYAPPFCGGFEFRLGFASALRHAKQLAAKAGTCTLLIGDVGSIGGGDPFLPADVPPDCTGQVYIRVVNFHLRPHVIATPLQTAWRYFDHYRRTATVPQLVDAPRGLVGPTKDIEVFVRRDPERLLASLYVANPLPKDLKLKWKQRLRREGPQAAEIDKGYWRALFIPSGCAAHLETVFQGELPWVRQLRFAYKQGNRRMIGALHLIPSAMMRNRLPLIWGTD